MIRVRHSLFTQLFGLFVFAILLAHVLGYIWFHYYAEQPVRREPPPLGPDWMSERPEFDFDPNRPEPPPFLFDDHPPPGQQLPPPPPSIFEGPQVLFILQLIASVIAAWFGARQLTRPIRQLSAAAERLSTDLDSPALSEQGPDELVQAARTFNRMQRRINEQIRLRSGMLTAVSHDLRTPVARMKLRLEHLEDGQTRQRLGQDLDEMMVLLDSTLSYMHAQSATESRQYLDIQALVESLVENAQEHGADAQVIGHCQPLWVQPLALRSCVSNLLNNALRYAGQVRIELRDQKAQLEIRVCDHGPGIPADQREAVFEPFYRLDRSRNKDFGGTGLGLTIARETVVRQGGSLMLEDTPGGGLTAVLCLPRLSQ